MVVGLCVERSLEMVVGLLGILKAGGAYLPLDPAYPPERLAFMLEDAAAPVLLTQSALRERCRPKGPGSSASTTTGRPLRGRPTTAPPHNLHPGNTAYVIYTSGSTGTPKGVVVTHRGIPNLAAAQIDRFAITACGAGAAIRLLELRCGDLGGGDDFDLGRRPGAAEPMSAAATIWRG